MNIPSEFDEIRPYKPEELPQIFEELIADTNFRQTIEQVLLHAPFEQFAKTMRSCKSNEEFQYIFCKPFLEGLVKNHSDGLTDNFDALPDKGEAYTFISNHRDIVLDSAFLSLVQLQNNMRTVEIAIGDNLLISPWIKKLVRINKSFIVQRALTMREMLESSKRLSRYIHFTIAQKHNSVWIAQREGRAKDSNDRTQESVLKMLSMEGEGTLLERFTSLNIVPLTISYEYDPCDYLKAQEFQQKRDNAQFKKSKRDDLVSMRTGIFGYKGRIHYQASACINRMLRSDECANLSKNELLQAITTHIDRCIHQNYQIYPINYVAYEILSGDTHFKDCYTANERAQIEEYFAKQYDKIDLRQKDEEYLLHKLYEMYANPLINKLKTEEP